MRLFAQKIWDRLRGRTSSNHGMSVARRPKRRLLELEALEDRFVPQATASGAVSGVAFVDANHSGVLGTQDRVLAGITVDLTGTATGGTAVNLNTTTDANGVYSFLKVAPGVYQVSVAPGQVIANSGGASVSGITVSADQTSSQNLGSSGLLPGAISLRMFLASTTSAALPAQALNHTPVVNTPIANVAVATNSSPTTIDLAANFTDAALGNTMVQLDTSSGTMDIELLDTTAPQTVANFLDYVEGGDYSNDIFHRLTSVATDGLGVLQGGGFTFEANPSQLVPVTSRAPVHNEFSLLRPNTQWTVAMAKTSDPNSATSQFFINMVDNSTSLDSTSNSGGFTVFGKLPTTADQTVATALAALKATNESSANGAFSEIPLSNYSGTNFPTDTTAATYALINKAFIASRSDSLSYSVASNSNPGLVTTSINNELLNLQYTAGQTGTATITVRATDQLGSSVTTTFTVTVS